jgi:hypothetical protein
MPFSTYEFLFAFFVFLSPAFAGYVFAGYFEQRSFANKLIFLLVLTGGALDFHAMPVAPGRAHASEASSDEKSATSPIRDAVNQNTPGQSDGYPVGVPGHFAWYRGSHKPPGASAPPPDFTAVTGWGQVYPKVAAPKYTDPEGRIVIADAKTYVHLSVTREWILVQDQSAHGIAGAYFVSDFKPRPAPPLNLSTQPDGSVVIGYPKPGYNNHFWVIDRGTYPAGSVDGVYVQMDMRVSDPNMKFVANVGADWWRDASAVFLRSFVNNPGAGMSNWIELSTDWTTLYFYSWSTDRLLTDPPPPLAETKSSPTVVRRRASSWPTYLPDRRGDSPIIVPSPTSRVASHPR